MAVSKFRGSYSNKWIRTQCVPVALKKSLLALKQNMVLNVIDQASFVQIHL
jgi:hypothetical protein